MKNTNNGREFKAGNSVSPVVQGDGDHTDDGCVPGHVTVREWDVDCECSRRTMCLFCQWCGEEYSCNVFFSVHRSPKKGVLTTREIGMVLAGETAWSEPTG